MLIAYKTGCATSVEHVRMNYVRIFGITAALSIGSSTVAATSNSNKTSPSQTPVNVASAVIPAGQTLWKIEGSPAFDACCLLNTLTGDPYYLEYYQADFDRWSPKLSAAGRTALARLRANKEKSGQIISAQLTLYLSAVNVETLPDVLAALREPDKIRQALQLTPYYSESNWTQFVAQRDDLIQAFEELRANDFERDWRETVLPKVTQRREQLREKLPSFDITSHQERLLGFALPSHEVTIYLLYYSEPHGIKIVGTRFITHVKYPERIVLNNAIHEMMHPPYRLQSDPELRKTIDQLRECPFLMERILHHNPSFGYNNFEGFVEEDCVQALEQIINESFNVATEAHKRWQSSDDGMHVLAVALYQLMKKERFSENPGSGFRDFLVEQIRKGALSDKELRRLNEDFAASSRK
jgi:hypothetical protein